jgi:hypothetical protein
MFCSKSQLCFPTKQWIIFLMNWITKTKTLKDKSFKVYLAISTQTFHLIFIWTFPLRLFISFLFGHFQSDFSSSTIGIYNSIFLKSPFSPLFVWAFPNHCMNLCEERNLNIDMVCPFVNWKYYLSLMDVEIITKTNSSPFHKDIS